MTWGIASYNITPASNSAVNGTNIAEGCNASGINDAIRQIMADLAVYTASANSGVLGSAALVNTGTSGATVPLLNGANTWAAGQTFSVGATFTLTASFGGLLTASAGINVAGAAVNEALVATVASAATVDLGAVAGNHVHITGAVAITSFGTTGPVGARRKFVFDGALILTNSANLILPSGANIPTAAGDCGEAVCESITSAGRWRVENYTPATGKALVGGITAGSSVTMNPYAVNSGSSAIAHGLGQKPDLIIAYLECVTGELGYSAGDRVMLNQLSTVAGSMAGAMVNCDATNCTIVTGNEPNGPILPAKTGGGASFITAANWKVVATPYKFA